MAHSVHQFAKRRAGRRGQRVSGVAQVVEMGTCHPARPRAALKTDDVNSLSPLLKLTRVLGTHAIDANQDFQPNATA